MKKVTTKALLTALLLSIFGLYAQASHFAGSGITYTALGNNMYKIKAYFYRDCSGVPAPSNIFLEVKCVQNSIYNFVTNLNPVPNTGINILPTCTPSASTCNGGNLYGIQEFVYEGTVNLAAVGTFVISFSSCCRNPSTVLNGSSGYYIEARINTLLAPGNSSPEFLNKPIVLAANGMLTQYNPGIFEANGDSISVAFYTPMSTDQTTVTYNAPYTTSNFLSSSTPITLDPNNGNITFTPNMNLTTLTAIKVDEWREINGVMQNIGSVVREVQLKVDNQSGHIPQLSGMDLTNSATYNPNDTIYEMEFCYGNFIDFDINVLDIDTFNANNSGHPEQYSLTWNQGVPGANFVTHYNGTDSAYAHFSYYPQMMNQTLSFTVEVADESCPYALKQSRAYVLHIKGIQIDLGAERKMCKGEVDTVFLQSNYTGNQIEWSLDSNVVTAANGQNYFILNSNTIADGLHLLTCSINDTSNNSCPGSNFIAVWVAPIPQLHNTLPDTSFCSNDVVIYDAGPGLDYMWKLGNNIMSYSRYYQLHYSGNMVVEVNSFVPQCADSDTFHANLLYAPPSFDFGSDTTILPSQSLTLNLPLGYDYYWSTGDTTPSLTIDSTFNWINKIVGQITAANGCKTTDTIRVFIGNVGMEENNGSLVDLLVYPNPVQNILNLNMKNISGEYQLRIFDIQAKEVLHQKASNPTIKIDVSSLEKGVYIISIQHQKQQRFIRFVKE